MARSLCYYCTWGRLLDISYEWYFCSRREGGLIMRPQDRCPFFARSGDWGEHCHELCHEEELDYECFEDCVKDYWKFGKGG